MKLTTKTRYGLRALIDIAINSSNGIIFLKDVARRQEISLKYLDHIITDLKKAGFIKNIHAKHGGYQLTRPSDEIFVDEIIEAMEGSLSLSDCVDFPGSCKRYKNCVTKNLWSRTKEALRKCFHIKLSELVDEQREMLSKGEQAYHI